MNINCTDTIALATVGSWQLAVGAVSVFSVRLLEAWISFPGPQVWLSHRLSIMPLLSAYPCKIPAVRFYFKFTRISRMTHDADDNSEGCISCISGRAPLRRIYLENALAPSLSMSQIKDGKHFDIDFAHLREQRFVTSGSNIVYVCSTLVEASRKNNIDLIRYSRCTKIACCFNKATKRNLSKSGVISSGN